jgi:hypothetical protein
MNERFHSRFAAPSGRIVANASVESGAEIHRLPFS